MILHSFSGHTFHVHPDTCPDIVLDLGANVGDFARAVLDKFGCQTKVISFEPTPSLLMSDRDNWIVRPVAVIEEDKDSVLFWYNEKHWDNSIIRNAHCLDKDAIRVPSIAFSKAMHAYHPEWVKMDIEMAEYDIILKSDPALLRLAQQYSIEFHDFIDGNKGIVYDCIAKMLLSGFSLCHTQRLKYQTDTCFVDALFIRNDLIKAIS